MTEYILYGQDCSDARGRLYVNHQAPAWSGLLRGQFLLVVNSSIDQPVTKSGNNAFKAAVAGD